MDAPVFMLVGADVTLRDDGTVLIEVGESRIERCNFQGFGQGIARHEGDVTFGPVTIKIRETADTKATDG